MAASPSRSRAGSAPATRRGDEHELRNYKLEARIGQDELATIYRACHLTLDRPVEVHILRRSDWISVSRFQQAARLAARLNHPAVLPVIDAGYDDRYGYYLVTPPVNGRPLQALLEHAPLAPAVVLRIISQIARALDAIHELGIIHRDLQPATIIVAEEPQAEAAVGGAGQPGEGTQGEGPQRAYLANFSLAYSPDGPDLSQLDEADYLTPYAAPEQNFRDQEPTPALDIYALGAVLFHMLTGEVPPAPGQEIPSLARWNEALAPADRVLRRMLSPQPSLRYPSASQAVAALRQALRDVVGPELPSVTAAFSPSPWPAPIAYPAEAVEAEWLENPAETILGDVIDPAFLQECRAVAAQLHQITPLRRLLDEWSRGNLLRRRQLGTTLQLVQVVSYTFYFYELRAYYETRTQPEVRERPHQGSRLSDRGAPPDIWSVELPATEHYVEVRPQEMAVPNSALVLACPRCSGEGQVICEPCSGRGTVEVSRAVQNPDGSKTRRTVNEDCSACSGEGGNPCPRCQGTGQLYQEQVFQWSRWAKIWENTDDEEGLPLQDIRRRARQVYKGVIAIDDPRWHAVAPLHELLEAATKVDAEEQTRLLHAELTIYGTFVSEVDYNERSRLHTLYLIGLNPPTVRGDATIFDKERLIIGLAALVALLVTLAILLL